MTKKWLLLLLLLVPVALVAGLAASSPAALEVVVRNTPQLGWATRVLPPAPAIRRSVAPTAGDGSQTGALYVPSGPPAPGVLLINGAEVPGGWRSPDVETFATSIADLGLVVYVPDLPGFERGALSLEGLAALKADLEWFSRQPELSSPRVALTGICVGGSLGLVLAEDAQSSSRIHSVVALDPYSRIRDGIQAATTGQAPGLDGRIASFQMEPWVRTAMVQSLASTIGDDPSRTAVLRQLAAGPEEDPLRGFKDTPPPEGLSSGGTAWWRLLGNTEPARFDELFAALPSQIRADLETLSPGGRIGQVEVPVLIAAPYHDFAFPAGEATGLEQGNPAQVRLTRTSALDHVTPTIEPSVLRDYWRLWQFAAAGINALR